MLAIQSPMGNESWQGTCSNGQVPIMRQIYRLSRSIWQKGPLRWLLAIALGAVVGIVAGHTVIASVSGSVCVVDGSSMLPTFAPGSRVYTAPIGNPLSRGDIVLIDDGNSEYALKRIVGMPGETIQLWRGYVFINRRMLREPYLAKHTYTFPDALGETPTFKIPPGQYFVMGDHRGFSVDSRRYGPILRDKIKSRVPSYGDAMRACFSAYTLPTDGKRNIKAL
jgi:signal peptidase I